MCCAIVVNYKRNLPTDFNVPTDMRGTLIDISKAFDQVWNEGLIFKLKLYGVDGNLSKLLENYLTSRLQRVVLNGQTSP